MSDAFTPSTAAEAIAQAGQPTFTADLGFRPTAPAEMSFQAGQPSFVATLLATLGPAQAELLAPQPTFKAIDGFQPGSAADAELVAGQPTFYMLDGTAGYLAPQAAEALAGAAQPIFEMHAPATGRYTPSAAILLLPTAGQPTFVGGRSLGAGPTVFPFEADGEKPIVERYGYLSEVIQARDGSEQRRALRAKPGGGLSFGCVFSTARDAQRARAILYGKQGQAIAVPRWNYAQKTTGDITAGDYTIPVVTTDVPFSASGFALLYSNDPYSCELVLIATVASDHLTALEPILADWPTGTKAIPVVTGRFRVSESMILQSRDIGGKDFEFSIERWIP